MKKLAILCLSLMLLSLGATALAQTDVAPQAVPWAWYISRSSALLAFVLMYFSIFFGLAIRTPFFGGLFSRLQTLNLHSWLALQALIFSLVHGLALSFDATLKFTAKDIFVPFASSYQSSLVALGTIGFYLMLVLVVTSYARKHITHRIWRSIHSLNVGLYFIIFIHALYLGTDLQAGILRSIFIWANVVLALLFSYNLFLRLVLKGKTKTV